MLAPRADDNAWAPSRETDENDPDVLSQQRCPNDPITSNLVMANVIAALTVSH